jgi:hypothetical protein
MQPMRLLLTLLGGVAALALLSSVSRRSVSVSGGDVPRSASRRPPLPLHFNRLASYYRPCVN